MSAVRELPACWAGSPGLGHICRCCAGICRICGFGRYAPVSAREFGRPARGFIRLAANWRDPRARAWSGAEVRHAEVSRSGLTLRSDAEVRRRGQMPRSDAEVGPDPAEIVPGQGQGRFDR